MKRYYYSATVLVILVIWLSSREGTLGASISSGNCSDDAIGTCSQMCHLSQPNGTERCSCLEGFRLGTNLRSCEPLDPNWRLLYVNTEELGVLALNGSRTRFPVNGTLHSDFVTSEMRDNVAYWSSAQGVTKTMLDAPERSQRISVPPGIVPLGIAVDWITGNVYVIDDLLSNIIVGKNDSWAVVIRGIGEPKDLALHPNNGIMFWTSGGNSPAIMRSGMDGSSVVTFVTTNLGMTTGIAVDQGNGRVYWGDSGRNVIDSADFSGTNRRTVISADFPVGVIIFGGRVYWSESYTSQIKSADKFTGSNATVHVNDLSDTTAFTIFHVANQPILRTNPCQNATCSYNICVLTQDENQHRCLCPYGMIMDMDRNQTCVDPPSTSNSSQRIESTSTESLEGIRIVVINDTNSGAFSRFSVWSNMRTILSIAGLLQIFC